MDFCTRLTNSWSSPTSLNIPEITSLGKSPKNGSKLAASALATGYHSLTYNSLGLRPSTKVSLRVESTKNSLEVATLYLPVGPGSRDSRSSAPAGGPITKHKTKNNNTLIFIFSGFSFLYIALLGFIIHRCKTCFDTLPFGPPGDLFFKRPEVTCPCLGMVSPGPPKFSQHKPTVIIFRVQSTVALQLVLCQQSCLSLAQAPLKIPGLGFVSLKALKIGTA